MSVLFQSRLEVLRQGSPLGVSARVSGRVSGRSLRWKSASGAPS